MPFTPGGLFTLDPQYRAESGQTIRVEQHNPPLEDIAAGLSQVMVRDGRAPMVGPLNMNGFPITGLASSSVATSPATVAQTNPIGTIIDYAGDNAPAGWLMCAGQEVARSTYAALFAVIGTKFGVGNGSTTFNVPDARGRVSAGRDDMGGTAASRITEFAAITVGAVGGSQSVTLSVAQMPSWTLTGTATSSGAHVHTGNTDAGGVHAHSGFTDVTGFHAHSGSTSFEGNHQHNYNEPGPNIALAPGAGPQRVGAQVAATSVSGNHQHLFTTDGAGNHQHSVQTYDGGNHFHSFTTASGGTHTHPVTVASGGGATGHPNIQPTIIFNKLIRATYGV